jgi:hypothetical protein
MRFSRPNCQESGEDKYVKITWSTKTKVYQSRVTRKSGIRYKKEPKIHLIQGKLIIINIYIYIYSEGKCTVSSTVALHLTWVVTKEDHFCRREEDTLAVTRRHALPHAGASYFIVILLLWCVILFFQFNLCLFKKKFFNLILNSIDPGPIKSQPVRK